MGEVSNEKVPKKGKKKEKAVKVDLNTFLAGGTTSEEPSMDWAAELENDLQHRSMHRGSVGGVSKQNLPSGPRRLMDQQIDFSFLPEYGPFQLLLDNAPFDISEDMIYAFFQPVELKDVNLGQEKLDSYGGGRRQGPPVVEFNSRDDLIRAYTDKQDQNLGRRAVHLRSPHEQRNNQGSDRRNDFNKRDNDRFGDKGPGRTEEELGGNWRDNLPAQQPQQQFQRQDNRQDSRFNPRDDVRIERAPIAPPPEINFVRRSSRDEPVQPLPGLQPFDRQVGPRFGNFNRSDSQDDRASHDSFGSRGGSNRNYSTPYGDVPPAGFDARPRRQDDRFGGDRRSYNNDSRQGRDSRNSYEPARDVQIVRNPIRHPPASPAAPLSRQESYDASPAVAAPTPEKTERTKIALAPRTLPVEEIDKPAAASSAIFGGAKPVDTFAREREVEEKKRLELERVEEEKKAQAAQKAQAEKEAQEKAAAGKAAAAPVKPTVSAQSSSSESAPLESAQGNRPFKSQPRTGHQDDSRRGGGYDSAPHNRSGPGNYTSGGGSTSYYNSNNNRNNSRSGGSGSNQSSSSDNWQRNAPSRPAPVTSTGPVHTQPQPSAPTAAVDDADKQFVRRAQILRRVSSNASETSERESIPEEGQHGTDENANSAPLTGTKVDEEDVAGGGASDTSSQGGFTVVKKKERERPPVQQKSRTFTATARGGGAPSSRGGGRGASNSARSGNTNTTQPAFNDTRRGSGGPVNGNGYSNAAADGTNSNASRPNPPPAWRNVPSGQASAKTN